jgi:hypothetical protein
MWFLCLFDYGICQTSVMHFAEFCFHAAYGFVDFEDRRDAQVIILR